MKLSIKFFAVFLGVMLTMSVAARADSNLDPKIIIGDPACDINDPSCQHVTQTTFGFDLPGTSNTAFNGKLVFQNNTGGVVYKLFLTETAVTFDNVECPQPTIFFNFCQVVPTFPRTPLVSATIEFLNTLPDPGSGIPDLGVFSLDFEPGIDDGTWKGGTSFDGQVVIASTPEPGSKLLLLVELAMFAGMAFVTRRKFIFSSSNTR